MQQRGGGETDSEKAIEQYLVKKVREAGGIAYKFVSPGNRGVPDRVVVFPDGRIVFAEIKCDTGELSAQQNNQIKKLRRLNQTVRVIYSKEEVNMFMSEFGGRL